MKLTCTIKKKQQETTSWNKNLEKHFAIQRNSASAKKLRHRKGIHKNISQFNEIPHQQFTRFDQI